MGFLKPKQNHKHMKADGHGKRILAALTAWLMPAVVLFAFSGSNVLKVHSLAAPPGDTLLIEVEIINDDAFLGFNFDIPLPDGFTYVPESFALNPERSIDHSSSANVIAGNVLRAIAFSFQANPFIGNEGVVATFELDSPEIPGHYLLEPENAVIAGQDNTNILSDIIPGNIALFELQTLGFQVEDTEGQAIGDAIVSLNGQAHPPGHYVFEGLPPGAYQYEVSKTGYFTVEGQSEIVDQDVLIDVVMEAWPDVGLEIDHLETTHGTAVQVPVRATGFEGVVALTLQIRFNPAVLHATDPDELLSNLHPAFASTVSNLIGDNQINITWFGMQGVSIEDGAKLFDLALTFCLDLDSCLVHGSQSTLVFVEEGSQVVVDGDPFPEEVPAIYHDGSVFSNQALHSLSVDIAGTGTVTVNGEAYLAPELFPDHSQVALDAIPGEGFHFVGWTEDGQVIHAQPEYDFEITFDRQLQAGFVTHVHTINATAGEGGSIHPAGQNLVAHGSDRLFAIQPEYGSLIEDVLVDGVSIGPQESYHFENITQDHSIHAIFKAATYTLSFSITDQQGMEIQNAGITLNEEEYPTGQYVFPGLPVDTYIYRVAREGYFDADGQVDVLDQDVWLDIEMVLDDTGLHGAESVLLLLYPNPACTRVKLLSEQPMRSVALLDIQGQELYKGSVAGHEAAIPLHGLRPGLYLLRVQTLAGWSSLRLLVKCP